MIDESQHDNIPELDEGQASDESLVKTHQRIRREPFFSDSPVLFFSAIALMVALIFAWFYERRYMGNDDPQMYLHDRAYIALYQEWQDRPMGPVEYDYFAIGENQYTKMACVGCHQADGEGDPAGLNPPLAGSEYVIHEDASLSVKILLAGLVGPVTVKGKEYNGVMAAFGASMKDHELAGLLTYIRQSWGNEASEVTLEEVAAVRAEIGSRAPWTASELQSYFD